MGWKTRTFLGILLAVESSTSDGEGDSALTDDKFSSIINQKNRDKVGIRPNKELITMKIVSDSSCNIFQIPGANFATVPMKVVAGEKEYIDVPGMDVQEMVEYLKTYKGKSGSSCPNVQEWLDTFEGENEIFCITISKNLSGSYNAAQQAAATYMEENPGSRVFIFDSLSAGPEMAMLAEKIQEEIAAGHDFETVKTNVLDYQNHCHTLFCLKSMMNLARNGRVHPAVAKIAGMLSIRVAGDASNGQITDRCKPRGDKKATEALFQMLKERGFYDGALLRIAHCFDEKAAMDLVNAAKAEFPNIRVKLEPTTALCSFYAEEGGMIIGLEGGYNETNNNTIC